MTKLSAGSYDLNLWLHGGYESEVITTLYGGPGSGKTNFCLLAAVSQAKKGHKVLFIDTEGGFSTDRIKQLAGDDASSSLANILLLKPTTFDEQREAFKQLLRYISKDHFSLIVVDGMTMLYRLEFARAREEGLAEVQRLNAELARQMRVLAEIARKQGLPVLVTNQQYTWDNDTRMVAGDILRYWSKCLIELVHENGKRTAYLRKHRSLAESTLSFTIVREGIKRRGWL